LVKDIPKDDIQLIAETCRMLGIWEEELIMKNGDNITTDTIQRILKNYKTATELQPNWSRAWYNYALFNSRVIERVDEKSRLPYIVEAINGYLKSITLNQGNSIQDVLRLLTLWFKYGDDEFVMETLQNGFKHINIDIFLQSI